ncbi:acid phosphatase (class A) [Sphingomonas vulcanisoli]|uniref:Acid phosphatase n=1 Tax=Sphingomonas vulcanisoli TaxID=1658060 RepID=A0ABX0TWG6_9SPHN|nr:phosphatase PAP2 family protein [Sphingomonas vulcanisoli]NIJ08509.1 acid phosphatase (class A) [Sphingomonas vulcanisoli]
MRHGPALAFVAFFLIAAKPAPTGALLLDAGNFDPALLLPPPPADNSAIEQSELDSLHAEDRTRTPVEAAQARTMGETKTVSLFADAIGPGFDLDRLPATKALFQTVRQEEKAAVDRAKDHFRRNRPWIVDASLHACATNDDPQSSYPSGHTTMAYSMAAILARLVPDRAPAILSRAADYAHSRIICEQHFPSDLAAGQAFGMMIAERLMQQPAFQRQFQAAAAEMRSVRHR